MQHIEQAGWCSLFLYNESHSIRWLALLASKISERNTVSYHTVNTIWKELCIFPTINTNFLKISRNYPVLQTGNVTKKYSNAETRWCAGDCDSVQPRELIVLGTVCGQNVKFSRCNPIPSTPSSLCRTRFLIRVTFLGFSYLCATWRNQNFYRVVSRNINYILYYVCQVYSNVEISWASSANLEVDGWVCDLFIYFACLNVPKHLWILNYRTSKYLRM